MLKAQGVEIPKQAFEASISVNKIETSLYRCAVCLGFDQSI